MNAAEIIAVRLVNSTVAGMRVDWGFLPQNQTLPAITYQQISNTRQRNMGEDGPIQRSRVQVNCWGKTYKEARLLAGNVEVVLSRYRGSVAGVEVLDIQLLNDIETFHSDAPARRVIQDYEVIFSTEI